MPTTGKEQRGLSSTVLMLVGILIWVIISGSMIHRYWSYTNDDAFISLRYVDNLSNNHGLVYNMGERVEAYTNFLWIIITFVVSSLGISPLLCTKLLGIAISLATIILVTNSESTTEIGKRHFLVLSIVIIVIFGSNLPFWIWAVAGLETPLYMLLLVMVSAVFVPSGIRPSNMLWCIASLALALTRPEGLAISFLMLVTCFVLEDRSTFKSFMKYWCITIILYALFRLGSSAYFHHIFPTSFMIRESSAPGVPFLFRKLSVGRQYVHDYFRYYGIYPLILIVLLRIAFLHRFNGWRGTSHTRMLWYIVSGIVGSVAIVIYFGGDPKVYYRLIVPLLPLIAIGVKIAMIDFFGICRNQMAISLPLILLGCLLSLLLFLNINGEIDSRNYRRLASEYAVLVERTAAGLWAKDHTTNEAVVLSVAAGAAPYYSERTAYDGALTQYSTASKPFTMDLKRYKTYLQTAHGKFYVQDVIDEKRPCVIVGGSVKPSYRHVKLFPKQKLSIGIRDDCELRGQARRDNTAYMEMAFDCLMFTKTLRESMRAILTEG